MEITKFIYQNQEVAFEVNNANIMVNATEMAKIFNKKIENFTRIESTQNFIQACLDYSKTENSRFLTDLKNAKKRFLNIETESDLIVSKQKSGTWMHRVLALKFAAWLNPDFELWVYCTIDQLLFGHYKEQKEATIEKLKAEQDLAQKKEELLTKYPEFADFLALENKITEAEKKRPKAMRKSVKQLKLDLFPAS